MSKLQLLDDSWVKKINSKPTNFRWKKMNPRMNRILRQSEKDPISIWNGTTSISRPRLINNNPSTMLLRILLGGKVNEIVWYISEQRSTRWKEARARRRITRHYFYIIAGVTRSFGAVENTGKNRRKADSPGKKCFLWPGLSIISTQNAAIH